MTSSTGYRRNLDADCHGWAAHWRQVATSSHAPLALVVLGAWDVFDLIEDGHALTFGYARLGRLLPRAAPVGHRHPQAGRVEGRPARAAVLPAHRLQRRALPSPSEATTAAPATSTRCSPPRPRPTRPTSTPSPRRRSSAPTRRSPPTSTTAGTASTTAGSARSWSSAPSRRSCWPSRSRSGPRGGGPPTDEHQTLLTATNSARGAPELPDHRSKRTLDVRTGEGTGPSRSLRTPDVQSGQLRLTARTGSCPCRACPASPTPGSVSGPALVGRPAGRPAPRSASHQGASRLRSACHRSPRQGVTP